MPDETDPFHNMTAWCRGFLEAAADHLTMWADHVAPLKFHPEAENNFTLRPTLTLARAAMESAAQSIWILSPDDQVRRAGRYFLLAASDLDEQTKAATSAEAKAELAVRRDEIFQALGVTRRSFRPPRYLQILRDAASFLGTHLPEGEVRSSWMDADRVERLWRSSAGAAHGKMWPDWEYSIREEHASETYSTPDHVAMAEVVHVAATLFAAGVTLLTLRSGREDEGRENWRVAEERLLATMTLRTDL
jgi:hypothetical protein